MRSWQCPAWPWASGLFLGLLLFLLALPHHGEAFAARAPPPGVKQYFASCSGGLSAALEQELLGPHIGASKVEMQKRGCAFWGDEACAYRALIWSRVANSMLQLMVRQRGVVDRQQLYGMARRIAWPEAMGVEDSLAVQCVVGADVSPDIAHTHYSSLTIKNAVVDNFREATGGRRPNVDAQDPSLALVLFLQNDEAWLYRSLSGVGSLHKRGYREQMHKSSLRETTAAAMLQLAGYDPQRHVLVDPMCGAGTIAIEAALMARDMAPGLMRLRRQRDLSVLAPARWPDTDLALLKKVVLEAKNQQLPEAPQPILANDWHPGAIELAKRDAGSAGVFNDLTFSNADVDEYRVPRTPTMIVTNPPWDLRLNEGAGESWEALGRFLKREAGNSDAFLLSGNPDVTKGLRMKVKRKIPIDQAGMSLRLLHYNVLPPLPRAAFATEEEAGGEEREAPFSSLAAGNKRPPPKSSRGNAGLSTSASAAVDSPASLPDDGLSSSSPSSSSSSVSRKDMLSSSAATTMMGALVGTALMAPTKPKAAAAASSLKEQYDRYASTYNALDGGRAAAWLGLEEARHALIGQAYGRVLECGCGTGLNLPYYAFDGGKGTARPALTSLDAIDLSPGMLREAQAKTAALGVATDKVRFQEMDVGSLAFADGTFDAVIDTFSLCVYPDPVQALKEMARVCKKGTGRVLLLENSRSNLAPLAAYQDATANLVADHGGKGCRYNQDVPALCAAAGLRVLRQKPLSAGFFTMLECECT